ncbi:DUF368 domain-containing protein [Haloechinothrix sp. LS1_15]|uniref:DUF368 domain-containing protein n=1 Tax=Haloechinothrix sp. LS1_15 TaxID=2652248 RepID=UPI002945E1D7|nr:DUF368 domain-containing protein [Haloechinothrix sp. LS1_15]MDV6011167.1 DUF368 domain-containing protein [Haloechinothrix sp. LS1_15]
MAKSAGTHLFNAFRGGLIGTAEVVPGVSGGTVALIVGIYDRLIISAGHVVSGLRITATDLARGRGAARAGAEFRRADWPVVLAALAGMAVAIVLAARLLAPAVENHPQYAYAVFFGLVLAGLWVPYRGSGRRWSPVHYLLALAVGAAAFVLTGLPPTEVRPNPLIVVLAAAVAVSALVLPGVSGSFLLLTFGLYTATLNAVNDGDVAYLATFAFGAFVGLALFVKLLQWLLEHHHHVTLVVMTGLMAGSLRALWPWQPWEAEERTLLAPTGDVAATIGLMVVGAVIVASALIAANVMQTRRAAATTVEA